MTPTDGDRRRAALADSLRANLRKRKEQQRRRGERIPGTSGESAGGDLAGHDGDRTEGGGGLWRLAVDGVLEADAGAVAEVLERSLGEAAATVAVFQSLEDGPWTVECLIEAGANDPGTDGAAESAADPAGAAGAAGGARTAADVPGIAAAAEAAGAALAAAGFGVAVTLAPVADRDWVAESQKRLPPIRAGRFTVFGPHDRGRIAASRFAIEIEAARAFGTGHHATTQGCLIALDRIAARAWPRRVLDVGTGSGVLAIAALKAGAAVAVGTDIDPVAARTARANARLAGVGPRARFFAAADARHPLVRPAAPFGLVFANILARPLIGLAPELARLLAPKGRLVLSGLRTADARPVIAAYRAHGLVLERRVRVGDWPTLVLRRPAHGRPTSAPHQPDGAHRRRVARD